MGRQLTLVAEVGQEAPVHPGLEIRTANVGDVDALGVLYFESYEPGVVGETLEEATADIRASFEGVYGDLLPPATLVAVDDDAVVGAVMTVRRAPWEDLPDCPFVIELFVDRESRGRGIGRTLMARALDAVGSSGESRVALRVDSENEPALALYKNLGFQETS